jgi:hypothetical protein
VVAYERTLRIELPPRQSAFLVEDHRLRQALLVCNESRPRKHGNVLVLPWRGFLEQLWGGEIVA